MKGRLTIFHVTVLSSHFRLIHLNCGQWNRSTSRSMLCDTPGNKRPKDSNHNRTLSWVFFEKKAQLFFKTITVKLVLNLIYLEQKIKIFCFFKWETFSKS